jgi:hypothetical protein
MNTITELSRTINMLMAHPDNEPNSEFADRIDSLIDLKEQLTLTDVGWSEVFTKYGKPFTSGRDLWDWLKDNCKVVLKT